MNDSSKALSDVKPFTMMGGTVKEESTLLVVFALLIIDMSTFAFQMELSVVSALPSDSGRENVAFSEEQVVSLVNGSRAYDFDLELENISSRHFGFRAAGSQGANETAFWIKDWLESFGLDAWLEPFQFAGWDLLSEPSLVVDADGDQNTTSDQVSICSFQCEHFSWFTPDNGVFADLAVLPLPSAADRTQIGRTPIDTALWDAVNTTGKIVLIGREVRMAPPSSNWMAAFTSKLRAQPPAAVIHTWWYDWMSFVPAFFSSAGGRPLGGYGPYYWDAGVPVGFIDYSDGLWIRNMENSNPDLAANVSIRAVTGNVTNFNVVGKIGGYSDPDKLVIISSHYDTVTCNGFCDNGAGTAGVLELAKILSEAVQKGFYKPSYTILFVTFTCEELYCVGSVNYIRQHKAEMGNITAVINLDCIGNKDLYVTETDPFGGFDLSHSIVDAAQALGVSITVEPFADSDHESFRNPSVFNSMVLANWNFDANISDATSVTSSAMLESFPLLYSDKWYTGTPGWIHTPYDNSTSTATLDWVAVGYLENHIRVAALATIRVSPDITIPEYPVTIALTFSIASSLCTCFLARKRLLCRQRR
jgi:hypothetical protein